MKKLIMLSLVGALLLAGCLGGQAEEKPGKVVIPINASASSGSDGLNSTISVAGNITATSSCGSLECFGDKFKACQPASLEFDLSEGVAYKYEVLGMTSGKCLVKMQFTKYPVAAWVGKQMTCPVDTSSDFKDQSPDLTQCTGELADLLKNPAGAAAGTGYN